MTKANTTYLKDYQAPQFSIPKVDMVFRLADDITVVTTKLSIRRTTEQEIPLVLDGEKFRLVSVEMNDVRLNNDQYSVDNDSLTLYPTKPEFELTITTELQPYLNTELSGLYQSSGNFCTQCEAEGFRRITYFLDRPDVLSVFTVTIVGEKQKYPVMLSNGNLQAQGVNKDGLSYCTWHDPHPKPSYLFALVAGDLQSISDQFITTSGQSVELNIYTEAHNVGKCDHAMASLINSMRWDQQVYGREYDLNVYNIVAVDDFNMGAMENKGLNIFNSKYVLADQQTATDTDFQSIESVIGHEYFHNWSGNRVTCRDWFQLSLKEGFTVFRDQEFSADMGSPGVNRIHDVQRLRTFQFKEDASPMAHPVRPESYQEINNFYTATIYEKGAEVIRMLHSLVGAKGFRNGTDLYFDRFDGQAVTTEDFVQTMEQANDVDLTQFRLWYSQAGTPLLTVEQVYCAKQSSLKLTIKQHCPSTPGQADKLPLQIPIKLALFDQQGNQSQKKTLILTQVEQVFEFDGLQSQPVVSLLRGFSAPVKIKFKQNNQDLALLMQCDDDGFVACEASQRLALNLILPALQSNRFDDADYTQLESAYRTLLTDGQDDKAIGAEMLTLPTVNYIVEQVESADPKQIHAIRAQLKKRLANDLVALLLKSYRSENQSQEFSLSAEAVATRALKNSVLDYLVCSGQPEYFELALQQYKEANNMTDRLAAFRLLVQSDFGDKETLIDDFYQQWQSDSLVLDKWFAIQAMQTQPDVLQKVNQLTQHADFAINNPNKVRALIGTFASNLTAFHAADGQGYRFLADMVLQLNEVNPQIAARLMTCFASWRHFRQDLGELMRAEVQRIIGCNDLSTDVREIAEKTINQENAVGHGKAV